MKRILALILILTLILAGCSGTSAKNVQENGNEEIKDTITWAQQADVTSLDPQIGMQLSAMTVVSQMFDTLVEFDADRKIVGGIAESWEVLNDKQIKFNIRKGIKFHNGNDLTVEDVKFSIERARDSKVVGFLMSFLDTVEITDDNSIIVTSFKPYAPMLSMFAFSITSIVPKSVVEADPEGFAKNPIGSGPYKFVEWSPSEYVKMEAFNDYYRGAPPTQYLTMKVIPEATQRSIMLETGEIDLAYDVAKSDISGIKDNSKLKIFDTTSLKSVVLYLDCAENGALSNPKARKAIEHALNKDAIIDSVFYGYGTAASSIVAPSVFGYNKDLSANIYDVAKAKELLKEAGYPDGFEFNLWVDSDQTKTEVAQIMQSMLHEVGIKMNIQVMEYATIQSNMAVDNGFQSAMQFFNTVIGDADFCLYGRFHSASKDNSVHFSDKEVDAALDAARSVTDETVRLDNYRKATQILSDKAAYIPLYYEEICIGTNAKLTNFVMTADGIHNYSNAVIYK